MVQAQVFRQTLDTNESLSNYPIERNVLKLQTRCTCLYEFSNTLKATNAFTEFVNGCFFHQLMAAVNGTKIQIFPIRSRFLGNCFDITYSIKWRWFRVFES